MAGVRTAVGEARRGQHKLSELLSPEEKTVFVQWLGPETCVSASGICQLLVDDQRVGRWTILGTGIVCRIKDYRRRIFCVQFFDVNGQLLLEQRLYRNFLLYTDPKVENFLQFEGDNHVYGLNFTDVEEARLFKTALQTYEQGRQKQAPSRPRTPAPAAPQPTVYQPLDPGTLRKHAKRKKKLTRSDIGLPSQFRHLSHFDITPEKSFVKETARSVPKLDPRICNLLESIGERVDNLNNDEQEFICEFIEQQGGVGNVERELARGGTTTRSHSPLPFNQIVPTPTPIRSSAAAQQSQSYFYSAVPKARIACPPPPPPPPLNSSRPPRESIPYQPTVPPPPPPPGPPPSFGSMPSDLGNLQQPRANESLPGDLMAQIQRGKQLRPVAAGDTMPKNATVGAAAGAGIAQALARALAERREHMGSDEEASGNEEDDLSNSEDADWD